MFVLHLQPDPPQSHEGHNRLDFVGETITRDGEVKPYTEKATAEFFPTSDNSIEMVYISEDYGTVYLAFRREGQHVDMEKDHEEHRAMAKCLNLHGENFVEWHYHGADFCHKKSVLPTLDSDELHQVDGDWVLVWMVYDKIKTQHDPWVNLTSSHMEMRVQPDNHTVVLHERNIVGGKCTFYKGNLVLPQNSERIHRLHLEGGMQNLDGEWKPYNDTVNVGFFPSSENTMEMYYKSETHGPFLLMYRRYGHHTDVKDLEKDHEEHKAKAKYFGLSGENFDEWHYDGAADFCHLKSAPEKAES
uniref:Uncharacterized protein n=1 Tax=Neogobius melanostomus TaxID=47308 RepID=A0A8C6TXA1_9GOBI